MARKFDICDQILTSYQQYFCESRNRASGWKNADSSRPGAVGLISVANKISKPPQIRLWYQVHGRVFTNFKEILTFV